MSININFANLKINPLKMYGGKNGNKICVKLDGVDYMLKFPPKPAQNLNTSYINSCITEHVSCQIFKTLEIESQDTILGKYNDKIIVACRDFETDGFLLREFAHLKNTIIDSEQSGYGTELKDILTTFKEQQIINESDFNKFFWEMFVADAFLGNFDRHNGNWGILTNIETGEAKISPVYDCGSCLYPRLSEKEMTNILNSKEEIEKRIFNFPTSAIKHEDRKINYFHFLNTTENPDCLNALKTIANKVDLKKINLIIESMPYISSNHKDFYKMMIKERKEKIIDKALERIPDEKEPSKAPVSRLEQIRNNDC